jgi:hypothetical protein
MPPTHFTCPFCDRDTTVTDRDVHVGETFLDIPNSEGFRRLSSHFVVCPNPKCKKIAVRLVLHAFDWKEEFDSFGHQKYVRNIGLQLKNWNLIPPSDAKVFPVYIPETIRNDYVEACLIRALSPKASATLARRCLQGMIRNFWGIQKARLIDEIEELKTKVDPDTWKAIDALRKVGNIGAHMEKDINVIIEVDEDEAGKLIWLIELLLRDWYIARHERQQRLSEIAAVADAKTSRQSCTRRDKQVNSWRPQLRSCDGASLKRIYANTRLTHPPESRHDAGAHMSRTRFSYAFSYRYFFGSSGRGGACAYIP